MDQEMLADVIRRAQAREPAAFDVLVEEFGGRIYGLLFRLTGSRDDAEELAQEVFLRVVRMIGRYRHDGRFEPWLFRIAANLVRDRARRGSRQPTRSEPACPQAGRTDEMLNRLPSDGPRPDEAVVNAEDVERLHAAIAALPRPECEVIMLRHFGGLSFKEIAEIMGTPLGTALARAHRGLARLRALMETETEPARSWDGQPGTVVRLKSET
jgi:RNA polymerase sigma-70 factor (ECF subfamily)